MKIIYKTRTQLVVEILREQIINGEIKAGQALRQAALAEELNVSRIPVREALLQLEAEGLVSFEPHRGATATDLSSDQIDELFELRAMLEADLLAYSIPNISEESLEEATDILEKYTKAISEVTEPGELSLLNSSFHTCLYSGAARPQTQYLVDILNKNADRFIRMHILGTGCVAQSNDEHANLLAKCKLRDIDGAVSILTKHILHCRDEIKAFLIEREFKKKTEKF